MIWNIFVFTLIQTEAIDVDIDEILDMDTDDCRIGHLKVGTLKFASLQNYLALYKNNCFLLFFNQASSIWM